ncbi:MAG: hypothetical protein U0520_00180 [Candidatus Saccharimonadales bacterium]
MSTRFSSTAPGELGIETLEAVERMLTTPNRELIYHGAPDDLRPLATSNRDQIEFSLAAQLPKFLAFDPEVVLFTACSATPMVDVFRGIYDALFDQEVPDLELVHVTQRKSLHVAEDREVLRLKEVVADRRVAIVDQFVCYGGSILRGNTIAERCGADNSLLIPGRWYGNFARARVNQSVVTTRSRRLANELMRIGSKIAKTTAS